MPFFCAHVVWVLTPANTFKIVSDQMQLRLSCSDKLLNDNHCISIAGQLFNASTLIPEQQIILHRIFLLVIHNNVLNTCDVRGHSDQKKKEKKQTITHHAPCWRIKIKMQPSDVFWPDSQIWQLSLKQRIPKAMSFLRFLPLERSWNFSLVLFFRHFQGLKILPRVESLPFCFSWGVGVLPTTTSQFAREAFSSPSTANEQTVNDSSKRKKSITTTTTM